MANVPIVTEVTKAQLDALVAANGLNEGLQYKDITNNILYLAVSSNSLILMKQPNKEYAALLTQSGTNIPTASILCNQIGVITYTRISPGEYNIVSSGLFTQDKTLVSYAPYGGSITTPSDGSQITLSYISSSLIKIETRYGPGNDDGHLYKTWIKINLYD